MSEHICPSAAEVLSLAAYYIGYEEKASARALEDFHANRGRANYTKFQPPLDGGANGDQWCGYFASYIIYAACGHRLADACAAIYAPVRDWMSGYTPDMAEYFKKAGAWHQRPAPGDLVFFYVESKGRIGHVGIVRWVNAETLRFGTIEGNTSSKDFDDNGGCVAEHEYSFARVGGTSRVAGFGRPRYKQEEAMDINALIVESYRAILGRDPDEGGRLTWQAALRGGMQPADFIRTLAASEEKVLSLAAEKRRLIRLAYMGALGREADEAEVETWLATGLSVDRILEKIFNSDEYIARVTAIQAGES